MGSCTSKNYTSKDYRSRGHLPPDHPKKEIYIDVIQGNETHTYASLSELSYDFANIHIRFVSWNSISNCDFIIVVKNGDARQNEECVNKLPKEIRYYELASLPDSYNHFKNYVFLFTKSYLFGSNASY